LTESTRWAFYLARELTQAFCACLISSAIPNLPLVANARGRELNGHEREILVMKEGKLRLLDSNAAVLLFEIHRSLPERSRITPGKT
jgi:hypothetical protein